MGKFRGIHIYWRFLELWYYSLNEQYLPEEKAELLHWTESEWLYASCCVNADGWEQHEIVERVSGVLAENSSVGCIGTFKDMEVVQSFTGERKTVTPADSREALFKQQTCSLAAIIGTRRVGKGPATVELACLRKMRM